MTAVSFVRDERDRSRFSIDRAAFVDPDVFAEERAKIFETSWLYVGHETEVPKVNDFKQRTVAGRRLIFSRGEDNVVRVMHNSCSHRGAMVCREGHGNSRFFTCPYHAWSYSSSGQLVALPAPEAYGPQFDKAEFPLPSPRFESYRGFIFTNFDDASVPLEDFLGDAKEQIDLVAGQSEAGMEMMPGEQQYSVKANWKLLLENVVDGYHFLPVHQRYVAMLKAAGTQFSGVGRNASIYLGGGHMVNLISNVVIGRPKPPHLLAEEERRRDWQSSQYDKRTAALMRCARNTVVSPTLMIIDQIAGVAIRHTEPVAPGLTEVTMTCLAPADDSDEMRRARREDFLTFWGPAGLATPDDNEALEECQRGFDGIRSQRWSDLSRGMGRGEDEEMDPADEHHLRDFWRHWDSVITGTSHRPEVHRVPALVEDLGDFVPAGSLI